MLSSSDETIRQALVGNCREEHLFALTQALKLDDAYQAKVTACDVRIAAALERLRETAAKAACPRRATSPGKRTPLRPMCGPPCLPCSGSI